MLKVDDRIIQAERGKLADEYERCFRRILQYIERIERSDFIAGKVFVPIRNEIAQYYRRTRGSDGSR